MTQSQPPVPKPQPPLAAPPANLAAERFSVTPIEPFNPDEPVRFSMLLSGGPGAGKTWCAATFPRPVVIMADCNDGSLRKHAADFVGKVAVSSFQDFQSYVLPQLEQRKYDCDTIVLDSYSSLLYMLSQWVAKDDTMPNNQAEWGANRSHAQAVTRKLCQLTRPAAGHPGYWLVALSHEYYHYDPDGKLLHIRPDFPGSFKNNAGAQFDMDLWVEHKTTRKPPIGPDGKANPMAPPVVTDEYLIHTKPDRYRNTKDGMSGKDLPALPDTIENTFQALRDAWAAQHEHPESSSG